MDSGRRSAFASESFARFSALSLKAATVCLASVVIDAGVNG